MAIAVVVLFFLSPAEWAQEPSACRNVTTWNRLTGMDTSVPLRGVAYEYRLLVSLQTSARIFSNIDSAMLPFQPRRRAVSP
jgi:hypothetical protein